MTRIVTGAGYGVEILEFIESLQEEFDGSVTVQTATSFVIDVGDGYTIQVQGTGFANYFGDNPPLSGTVTGFTFKNGDETIAVVSETSVTMEALIGFVLTNDGDGFRDAVLGGDDVIYGAGENDVLRGFGGVDRLYGGGGDDIYYVETAGDTANEVKNQGTDLVYSSVSFTLGASSYVENLILSGSANINGGGNGLNNVIRGNAGNNTLDGGKGDDRLYGGAGNDTLNGGSSGADKMAGGTGNDTYYVNSTDDQVYEDKNEGTDLVYSSVSFVLGATEYVENLTLTGSGHINGTGNGIANLIIGNAGNNTLDGGKGDDRLYGGAGADILNGGSGGSDKMKGDEGNDVFHVNSSGDQVYEDKNEGTDLVYSSVSFVLGATQYVENLTLTGSANINGTGNGIANVIVGNSGANRIDGLKGQDRLTGGAGADTFVWSATSHSTVAAADRITDLSNADFIDLSAIDANVNTGGTQHFVLVSAFTNTAGQVTLSFDGTYTNLNADTNGDGVSDMLIRIDGNHTDFDNFIFGGG